MNQDELKTQAALAAIETVPQDAIIGVGTGSTVNKFIDGLAQRGHRIKGAVSSSEATTARLVARGFSVIDCNDVDSLSLYIDGADEIDSHGFMIKGGGGALTREKIVAALAQKFVCIADYTKVVSMLGTFPLPVEIIPMALSLVSRRFEKFGAKVVLRMHQGQPFVTDNKQFIIDVTGLHIEHPLDFETEVNQWPGVVTCGVFAHQKAKMGIIAQPKGVQIFNYS